ncbi:MAG TPA: hypothetical protein GXZ48_01885 [Acholeplasmataceae bacterium]|nr:hypothetical protein [Acholeplasmataceae bacterium]
MEKKCFLISVFIFPRAPRLKFNNECSCSNSCEKVLELLFDDNKPITFEDIPLSFNYTINEKNISNEGIKKYEIIKNICNTVITNRGLSIQKRLIILGKIFQNIERLSDENLSSIINISNVDYSYITNINLSYGIQKKLVKFYAERSISIQKYAEEAIRYFEEENEIKKYLKAKERLYSLFPNIEIMLEKILHNYMIYIQFPFSNNLYSLIEEHASLCGVYLFLKYIVLGYMANKNTLEDFIDVVTAIFRLINHTNFNHDVYVLLKIENLTTIESLENVI